MPFAERLESNADKLSTLRQRQYCGGCLLMPLPVSEQRESIDDRKLSIPCPSHTMGPMQIKVNFNFSLSQTIIKKID